MESLRRDVIAFVAVLVLVLAALWQVAAYDPGKSCTIFTAAQDGVVLYGNSEELAQGQRVVEMREFFSPATAEAGDAAYRGFAARFTAAKVAVIAAGLGLLLGLVALLVRRLRQQLREVHYPSDAGPGLSPSAPGP